MGENRRTGGRRSGVERCAVRERPRRSRAAAAVLAPRGTARPAAHRRAAVGGPFRFGEIEPEQHSRSTAGSGARGAPARLPARSRRAHRRTSSIRATRATQAGSCTSPPPPSPRARPTAGAPTSSIATTGTRRSCPCCSGSSRAATAPSVLTLHNVGYQGVFADDDPRASRASPALEQVLPADARAAAARTSCARGCARPIASRP